MGADMHEPPLIQLVILQSYIAVFQGNKDILGPGHQQPDDGGLFFRNGFQNPLGFHPFEDYPFAPYNKTPEPVHLCAGVIQGGNAQESIFMGLTVMHVLDDA